MSRVTSEVLVIGAGAAGLMAAAEAARRGRRVILLDHRPHPGDKIRASGGGHCNFTNLHMGPEHFISENPSFCISALKAYPPSEFLALLARHGLSWREKTAGQLFCTAPAKRVVELLLWECQSAGVGFHFGRRPGRVTRTGPMFRVETDGPLFESEALVVASGGLARPRMGASGFGYEVARLFGVGVVPPRPALTPLLFGTDDQRAWRGLAGVAAEVEILLGKRRVREALLFTHQGVSGPAVLRISSHWRQGEVLRVNFLPGVDVIAWLKEARRETPRQEAKTALARLVPHRLAERLVERAGCGGRMAELSDRHLAALAREAGACSLRPPRTGGYDVAEVTAGGVDTRELHSRDCVCRQVPGLYFVGELVDVTGDLGGYNLHWAWASGTAAGRTA